MKTLLGHLMATPALQLTLPELFAAAGTVLVLTALFGALSHAVEGLWRKYAAKAKG